MDYEQTLFYREIERIADALEENNKICKENVDLTKALYMQNKDWIEWNKAIRQENIEINEKRRQQEIALIEQKYDIESKKNDDRANKFNEDILNLYRQKHIEGNIDE
jgi:hypothetical protein